jgi:preprotein translocase subunit SecB
MENTTEVRFTKYIVHQMIFEINEHFDFTSKQNITLKPVFNRTTERISDDSYRVALSVSISKDHQTPFSTLIKISGDFKCVDWDSEVKRDIIIENSTSILFPFLRTVLSNLTLNANITPYVLPLVNVNRLFKDNKQDSSKT